MGYESAGIADKSVAAWRTILSDPDVQEWHATMELKKTGTADERGRVLYRYCKALRTDPASIVASARDLNGGRRSVERKLQNFVVMLHGPHKPSDHGEDDRDGAARERCKRGHSPGYVENFVKAVRSWCDHNDVVLRRIVVGDTGATYTENEALLLPEQVRAALNAASPRGKVVISLIAFAGVRPEVLGMRRADDGLTIDDLPDLRLDAQTRAVTIHRVPLRVVVRRPLSKVKRQYFSFLPAEAADFVQEYLEYRLARGEELTPKSPVIRADYNRERQGRPPEMRGSPFLSTAAITSEIRDALRAAGLTQRPYALRNYFVSRLESALRDGKITAHDKEFFEGRKTSIDMVYAYHKQLPPETIEAMRSEYAKVESYLGVKPSPSPIGRWNLTREELDALSVLLVEHMALGAKGKGHLRLPQGLGERFESLLDPDVGWADEKK